MPTLRQLEYLVALADLQHFGRAARACNVSQPSLSQQLRSLEQRLGTTLVERSAQGVQLTPVGRAIADRARGVLVAVASIRELAVRARENLVGAVRCGVSPTLGPYLMPDVISSLRQTQECLALHIIEGIPDEQVGDLARGTIDMMLTPLPVTGNGLIVEPLFRERLWLVSAPDHPLAQAGAVRRSDLAGTHVLGLDPSHHLHRQVAAICREYQMLLRPDYAGTSLDSLRQMAATGLGATILPDLYIRSEVGGEAGVVLVDVDGWQASRSIAAIWREGSSYSDAFHRIAETVRDEALRIIGQEAR